MSEKSLDESYYKKMEEQLKSRLSPHRFKHSVGVSEMAEQLAKVYDIDTRKARLAGLIHDWDKAYDDNAIRERALELNVEVNPEVFENMPRLLHGITAAAALRKDYPEIDEDILLSIESHTSGHLEMSDLDMVIYIADVIECSRPYPEMDTLRKMIGEVSLETLFFKTYKQVFSHLIEREHRIHPDTISVWNYYARRQKAHTKHENN